MLKLSAYLPSVENHDDMPSPLMDGDAVPAVVAPIAEINQDVLPGDDLGDVQVVEDISSLPVEELVELPPHLDPTPMQPLEGEVIQEELIAENLDTEASQLLGAQIAMEGYSVLLRTAGKNMTRQSAAFMAVGMRRASRLVPGVSLGMEDESSGTQVMAMQQAKVDGKGLGSKIAATAKKIWEWLKQKGQELIAFLRKSFSRKKEMQAQATYLIAASEAVASNNPKKVEGLEAPSGIKVAQVLDAIHGEDVRAPKSQTVTIPEALATYVTKNGKLDLSMTVENEVRTKVMVDYFKDATAFLNAITEMFKGVNNDTPVEQVTDQMSDLVKKHFGGKPGKWEIHGMFIERTAEGRLVLEKNDQQGAVEVQLPSPQEIGKYMKDVKAVLDSDVAEGDTVIKAYEQAAENMMRLGEATNLSPERSDELGSAMSKVLQGNSFEDQIRNIGIWLDRISGASIKAADFFLSHHLGKGNTVSQEDFERLPSKGLMVVDQPRGPGMGARLVAGAQQAWQKIKAFFAKLWQQFSDWVKNLWARLTGTEKQTDVLLLTNNAVPEDGQSAGDVAALPQGTRLKSVQAARMLGGPGSSVPGEAPVEAVAEPMAPPAPAAPSVPAGMVYVPEAIQLMVGDTLQIDPVWEEEMTNWLIRHYIPTQEKIVRDLISFAGSYAFDGGIMGYKPTVDKMVPQLFQGMPSTPVPGQRTITPGEGCKLKVSQEGMLGEVQPVAIVKKRPLDQALSRQKKLLRALAGLEKTRLVTERQRGQLNTILDRRVADGVAEADVTAFYNYMERSVMVSSAAVVANVIAKMCDARVAVADAMIVARAQGKK